MQPMCPDPRPGKTRREGGGGPIIALGRIGIKREREVELAAGLRQGGATPHRAVPHPHTFTGPSLEPSRIGLGGNAGRGGQFRCPVRSMRSALRGTGPMTRTFVTLWFTATALLGPVLCCC